MRTDRTFTSNARINTKAIINIFVPHRRDDSVLFSFVRVVLKRHFLTSGMFVLRCASENTRVLRKGLPSASPENFSREWRAADARGGLSSSRAPRCSVQGHFLNVRTLTCVVLQFCCYIESCDPPRAHDLPQTAIRTDHPPRQGSGSHHHIGGRITRSE